MVPAGHSTSVASNCNASSVQAGNSYPIAALLPRFGIVARLRSVVQAVGLAVMAPAGPATYSVGGTASGLTGTVTLTDNGRGFQVGARVEGRSIDFIVDTVSKAGPNPCPPIIVGVGLLSGALQPDSGACRSVRLHIRPQRLAGRGAGALPGRRYCHWHGDLRALHGAVEHLGHQRCRAADCRGQGWSGQHHHQCGRASDGEQRADPGFTAGFDIRATLLGLPQRPGRKGRRRGRARRPEHG